MPEKDAISVINKAQQIIKQWKKTEFVIKNTSSIEYKYFIRELKKYPKFSKLNLFKVSDKKMKQIISNYTLEDVSHALQTDAASIKRVDEKLLSIYKKNLNNLLEMKNTKGDSVIKKGEIDYSFTHLNYYLRSDKYLDIPIIYITNNVIVDDAMDMPVHTLIRGGLVNGFCSIHSKSILISTFPFYYESELFNNMSDEFKEKRTEMIAAMIAHELGHCYFGLLKDDYKNKSSLMYPVYKFDYLEWVKSKKYDSSLP